MQDRSGIEAANVATLGVARLMLISYREVGEGQPHNNAPPKPRSDNQVVVRHNTNSDWSGEGES